MVSSSFQLAADASLVATIVGSNYCRGVRGIGLFVHRVQTAKPTLAQVDPRALADVAVNGLSLSGSMFSATLRQSQGVFSFATCLADVYLLGREVPAQRGLLFAAFLLFTVFSVVANNLALFHRFGTSCAWVMTVGSAALLFLELFRAPPLSQLMVGGQRNLILAEKGLSVAACTVYLWMLFYDEPAPLDAGGPGASGEKPGDSAAAAAAAAGVPLFLPWFVNVASSLIVDAAIIARILLAGDGRSAPVSQV
jgi:hypothetical protein